MLDFAKVHQQILEMSEEDQLSIADNQEKVDLSLELFRESCENFSAFKQKLRDTDPSWLVADIIEPLDNFYDLPELPDSYTILATDGSQIIPSHHEVSSCYLINIGKVVLRYGDDPFAELSSEPTLYYKEEDLYIEDEDGETSSVTSEFISSKRTLQELKNLSLLAKNSDGIPKLSFSDGSLIMWHLEGKKNRTFRAKALSSLRKIFSELKAQEIPVVGYISGSRSNDVLNALRVYACPESLLNCMECDTRMGEEIPDCEKIKGLTDRTLFSKFLKKGQRTSVFGSNSKIIEEYGHHKIKFFYLNVGEEIVRIEFPQWIANDRKYLDLVHGLCFDQAQKGLGYPVALSEAHEQAVVKGKDREFFYKMIEEIFVRIGKNANITNKALSKRRPVV